MSSAAAVGPVVREVRTTGKSVAAGARTAHRVRGLFELGRELFEQEQYEAASLALQRRLRLAPDDLAARQLLAESLLASAHTARAAEALEPFRTSGQVDAGLCLRLGEALLPDDAKAARRWLVGAVQANADDEIALRRLAEVESILDGQSRRNGRHRVGRRGWWRQAG